MAKRQRPTADHQKLVEWILRVMEQLKITQGTLAETSGLSRPWVCQFLSYKRVSVKRQLLLKLKTGLLRLIEQRAQTDEKIWLLQGLETLFVYVTDKRARLSQSQILRIAADVLAVLAEKCPDPNEQLRVVNQLRVAIQTETLNSGD